MGITKEFWVIRYGEYQDQVEALEEETERLVDGLLPNDPDQRTELMSAIDALLGRASHLYRDVWRAIGKPDNEDSELLQNVKNRLALILLDEFSKWPESGSGIWTSPPRQ
jgi:hypothetical protein